LLIWLPIAGGVALLVMDAMGNTACRQTALLVSIATFLLSTGLYSGFDITTAAMQFQENIPWIDAFNANYHLGVDGISMPLIILTTCLQRWMPCCFMSSGKRCWYRCS
jgi:NADH-quinone oxidoreductase subunit M